MVEISIDIGGTFTDCYLRDDEHGTLSVKAPTTPDDLSQGLFDALAMAADRRGRSVEALLGDTERLIHGTTVATNAVLEGETATTALICTDGFRDTLTLREGGKEHPYDWDVAYPDPYVPRALTFGVDERIDAEGTVVAPLDEDSVLDAIDEIEAADVDAVAVALLWSHVNPRHERRIGDLLDEHLPAVHYSLSSEVCPIVREYRRTSGTAIDASLADVVGTYLSTVATRLEAMGYDRSPLVITANGGVMDLDEIERTPIWMVDAGPTMLPVAALDAAQTELDRDDVIALDMGGTSLDIGVVTNGSITRTREATVGDDHLLGIEKVDVRSIGSGGGSVAWVDDGGLIHVGPESAGSRPGPACYGRGGTEPTVTDAALALGYLDPEYFLGGQMAVDPAAAERALSTRIAEPLGISVTDAAHAVYATATQDIVNGINAVTLQRGVDPREYVVAGGGGALGTHVAAVARELGVRDVVLPRNAGVVSAVGGLASDVRRDFSESYLTESGDFDRDGVNAAIESMLDGAAAFFERAAVPPDRRSVALFAEARYPHQVWELDVELPFDSVGPGDVDRLVERFHRVHERTYGFCIREQDVQFLQWRVEAIGETGRDAGLDTPDAASAEDAVVGGPGEREAYVDGTMTTCRAYRAASLAPGDGFAGPGFVDAETTTIVVPPGCELRVTEAGNYHVTVPA